MTGKSGRAAARVSAVAAGLSVSSAFAQPMTVVLLKAVAAVTALRATQDEEREGLDISIHGEAIQ